MTVVLEGGHMGHRLEYVRLLVQLGENRYHPTVFVTSPRARASDEFAREIALLRHVEVLTDGVSEQVALGAQLRNLRIARRAAIRSRCSIVMPNSDEYLIAILLAAPFLRTVGLRGLIMRPPEGKGLKPRLKRGLIGVIAGLWRRIEFAEVVSPLEARPAGASVADPSGLVQVAHEDSAGPEPVDLDEVDRWLESSDDPVLGFVGVVDPRKSVLESIAAVASIATGWRVLVAGLPTTPEFGGEVGRAVEAAGPRAHLVSRSLGAAEFAALVASVDAIALLYQNESGSSGLVLHSLREGKPVLGYRNRTVRRVVEQYGAGALVTGLTPEEIAEGLRALPRSSGRLESFDQLAAAARIEWSALATGAALPGAPEL